MRNLVFFLGFAGLIEAASIPAGTHFLLRLEHSVSSDSAKVGDSVHLKTIASISDGATVIIPANSLVQAAVTKVKRGGRLKRHAELEMRLTQLMLPDGRIVQLSSLTIAAAPPRRSPSTPGVGPGALLGGSLVGLMLVQGPGSVRASVGVGVGVIAVSALVVRGGDVELQPGTTLDASFDQPVSVP